MKLTRFLSVIYFLASRLGRGSAALYFPQQPQHNNNTAVFFDSSSLFTMDAQPNFERLAEAFTASATAHTVISQEIPLVANLPPLNDGQRLFEAIERLTTSVNALTADVNTLTADVNTLRTDVNTLRTDVNTLRTDVNTLRTDMNRRFENLELRMSAELVWFSQFLNFIMITFCSSLNHTARVYNSHISNRNTPLRALHDRHNMAVEGFPKDPASLMRLQGQIKSHIEKLFRQTDIMIGNTLTTLLDAFQLPADGTLEAKKRRFREFVGLVVDA